MSSLPQSAEMPKGLVQAVATVMPVDIFGCFGTSVSGIYNVLTLCKINQMPLLFTQVVFSESIKGSNV